MSKNPQRRHIDILPDELLSEIQFITTYAHDDDMKRYRSPSVFCQVSRRWRGVAYSTPRIWSFILIRNEDTLGHTPDRLSRAGGVLLTIKIHDPEAHLEVEKVLEPLLPRCDRLVSLDMDVKSMKEYAAHFPKELPLLRNLAFKESGDNFSLGMALPRLERMNLQRSWLCWDPSIMLGCLKEFHAVGSDYSVRLPVKKLVDFLGNSPNLEVLELNDSWVFEEAAANGLPQAMDIPTIDLPKLKIMQLRGLLPWEIVTLFSCVRTPGLRNLMLSIDPHHMEEDPPTSLQLEEFHFNIPSVRDLVLGIGITKVPTEHILSRMPHVQTLSVTGRSGINQALVSLMTEQRLSEVASRLSHIYVRETSIPKLRHLLSGNNLTPAGQSLLSRATWKIRPLGVTGAVRGPEDEAQKEKVLEELHALIPKLEITEENQWWD